MKLGPMKIMNFVVAAVFVFCQSFQFLLKIPEQDPRPLTINFLSDSTKFLISLSLRFLETKCIVLAGDSVVFFCELTKLADSAK